MPMELIVGGLAPQDAGRGIARISRSARGNLDVKPGDIVEIRGQRRTVAKVLPGYEGDRDGLVRIDGNTRSNAGAGIDERVTVEASDAKHATEITIALPPTVILHGGERYFARRLDERPVLKGDTVRVALLGRPFAFIVTSTSPSGPVVVTEETTVTIRDRPIAEADLKEQETELPEVTYEDVGGLESELGQVREMIELPLRHPELFRRLGIAPPKGVLLYGPPGTGKTLIARAVANEVDAAFYAISGPEIMSKYYGESEEQLRKVFEEADSTAPAVIFIDELDSIAPSREEVTGEVERRVVAQLLSLMDGLETRGDVVVIAATNRVNAIDPALRRGGRFDREIEIGVPSRDGRRQILDIHTRGMPLDEDIDLDKLADRTYGFVGSDLESLVRESAMNALRRIRLEVDLEAEEIPTEVLERIEVTSTDFEAALADTVPSAMREVFVEVPNATWDDVGGLAPVKRELIRAIEWPLRYPRAFERLHTEPPKGVLLYGPPGTGKTLVARAVANASDANFVSVKGPELLDKYVGESERAVRDVFQRARQSAPTVIFFDEIDAIAPERGGSFDSRVTERVVSQLLTELDGIEELRNVVVVGATNRPDIIDPALLRTGRFEKMVYVPNPDEDARREILRIHTREMPLADDIDLDTLAERTEGYTGSDIEAIVREASMLALDAYLESVEEATPEIVEEHSEDIQVTVDHFNLARKIVKPSVPSVDKEYYNDLAAELGGRVPTELEEGNLGIQ
jgi:transitional endoplasmic reticulum ATPase